MAKLNNVGFRAIGIIILVTLIVAFGPMLMVWGSRFLIEHILLLDCHSDAGGSFPFPITACGSVLYIILLIYYVWFVVPIPFVLPAIAIILISTHFIRIIKV
jgi:hypothetical protein